MSHSRKKGSRPVYSSPVAGPKAKAEVTGESVRRTAADLWTWVKTKHPVLNFVFLFGLVLGLCYAMTLTSLFRKQLFPSYLQMNAKATHGILSVFGEATKVEDRSISKAGFRLDINRGCDAVEPTFLLIAAVLAFPAPWRRKLPGMAVGIVFLAVLNLVRIVTLYYVGVYWPRFFDAMHIEVWQTVFIVLALIFWGLWIQWAFRPSGKATTCPPLSPLPDS